MDIEQNDAIDLTPEAPILVIRMLIDAEIKLYDYSARRHHPVHTLRPPLAAIQAAEDQRDDAIAFLAGLWESVENFRDAMREHIKSRDAHKGSRF